MDWYSVSERVTDSSMGVGAWDAIESKRRKAYNTKLTGTLCRPLRAGWKRSQLEGEQFSSVKSVPSALFINPQMDPYKVVHGRDHVGKVGILSGGEPGCVCHLPGMLPAAYRTATASKPGDTVPATTTYAWQRSSKKEIQRHLRIAKKFKGGNLTEVKINSKPGNTTPLSRPMHPLHLPEHWKGNTNIPWSMKTSY